MRRLSSRAAGNPRHRLRHGAGQCTDRNMPWGASAGRQCSVHSYIVGKHGDSEIEILSSTNISGHSAGCFLLRCAVICNPKMKSWMRLLSLREKTAPTISIAKKQATYYGITMSVRRICVCTIRNERSILPVSSIICTREYGICRYCGRACLWCRERRAWEPTYQFIE